MPTKHAVLIGIDQYPHYLPDFQLEGCVGDARLMHKVLVNHFKFDEQYIRVLHDTKATREAILAEMARLEQVVEEDDIVVFHFSGHGRTANVKARPDEGHGRGDENWIDQSEATGRDSTIVPCDSGPAPHPNQDITDNYIHGWLSRLSKKTPYITLIFDSCHSGTITRDAFGALERAGPPESRPAEDIPEAAPAIVDAAPKGRGGWLAQSERYVVISGCEDTERSTEMDVVPNGALTFYLANALLRAKPGTTYRDVFEEARHKVTAKYKTQHPQIEGKVDREIFGTREIEAMRFIGVTAVTDDQVTLDGGAALGLRPGSLWDLYPPGTKETDPEKILATVRVENVGALTSSGVFVEPPPRVPVGARAVEKLTVASPASMAIDVSTVPEPERTILADAITASPRLSVASTPEGAAVRAYIIEPRSSAGPNDPMPNHPVIEQRTWALVDKVANLTLPLHGVAKEGVIDILVGNLEKKAHYDMTLQLENDATNLNVEFKVIKLDENFERAGYVGDDEVLDEGQTIAFEFVNRTDSTLWYCVLELEAGGAIGPLYPPRGRPSEQGTKKRRFYVGMDEDVFAVGLGDVDADEAELTYKAFFTNRQASFEWQHQAGFRSSGTTQSALTDVLDARPGDEIAPLDDPAEDWCAVTRRIKVRRV